MTLSKTEPEYSVVENSEKTYQQWDHLSRSDQMYRDQALGKLRLLLLQVTMCTDTLGNIQNSVDQLLVLLEEP